MLLYHGTSEHIAQRVHHVGLQPRKQHRGKANWQHAFAGNRHAVYLTDAYPITYAVEAVNNVIARTGKTERLAIIEVDTAGLETANLVPDEDVLEQIWRKRDDLPPEWSMKQRCRYYRDRLSHYAELWQNSLELLGTCAYLGTIEPTAIKRIAYIDFKQAAEPVWVAINAEITLMNYHLVGARHKAITRWFFDDRPPEMTARERFLNGDVVARIAEFRRDGITIEEAPILSG